MIVVNICIGLMGLGLVVMVHELGHLIAAKLAGIGVDIFSLGWGRKLIGRKIGETEYRISLFPIGGFVRLKGEYALLVAHHQKNDTIEQVPGGFFSANPWKRVMVALGGPVANLILALFIFTIVYSFGYRTETYSNRIVLTSSLGSAIVMPADEAGLQNGDRIVQINDVKTSYFNEIREQVFAAGSKAFQVIYERNGQQYSTEITPRINRETGVPQIGIYPWVDLKISQVAKHSGADVAGLKVGDTVLAINGQPVSHSIEFTLIIDDLNEAVIQYLRNGVISETIMVIGENENQVAESGIQFAPLYYRVPSAGLMQAIGKGGRQIWQVFSYTILGIGALFAGADVTNVVAGPVRLTSTIGEITTDNLDQGLGMTIRIFFNFLALISVALCFMNLLPIPALDGGQILLYLVEGVTRIRFSPRLIVRYQLIGAIMIAALLILALTSDVLYLFRAR